MRLCVAKMCSVRIYLFVLIICVVNGQTSERFKIVETTNGSIRGIRNTTLLKNMPFYSFRGIPYAKPPIGDLRFKAPKPIDPWKPNILDAFDYGNICFQPAVIICNQLPESEDCLTLNIFVPADVKSDEKLAVLFFIHGGSFRAGSGDDFFYGPDFIIERETILVTFNYRLGPLGFLSLNSTEYSGNMGLKDQQLALKWIHSNIERFGGDNQRITIFGQSAGGASVNYHILSTESRKYFRNAILMSGSIGNFWAMSIDQNHLKIAHQIAIDLNETKSTNDELMAFLKDVPADELHSYNFRPKDDDRFEIIFGPVIEKNDAMQPFLIDLPEKLYESTKIDVDAMFTVASHEMLSLIPKKSFAFLEELNRNFSHYVRFPFRGLNFTFHSEEYRNLTDAIRQFYFGNSTTDDESTTRYFEFLSDINFIWGINQSVQNLAAFSKGNTFFMWFAVDSKLNVWKKTDMLFGDMSDVPGAGHGDDLCYLFRCGRAQYLYDEILRNKTDEHSKISLQTIDYMTKIFTNFAKYGDPSYKNDPVMGFLPVQKNHTHFLNISNDGLSTGLSPHKKSIEFWTNIERRALELSNIRPNEIDSQ